LLKLAAQEKSSREEVAALTKRCGEQMEELKKQCGEAQDVTVGAVFKKLEALEGRRVEQVGAMAGEIQKLKAERDEWKKKFEALQAQGEGGRRPSASVSFIDLTND
jgi:chromosome segregation ATPase